MKTPAIDIIRKNSRPLQPIETDANVKLSQLDQIECIMFDVYGTLFVSGSGDVGHAAADPKEDCLAEAADACGLESNEPYANTLKRFYEAIAESHHQSKNQGIEFPEVDIVAIWQTVLGNQLPDLESARRFSVEFETRSNPVWPMPDLVNTLEQLAERHPLGIISNAQFFTLELFPALLGNSRQALGFADDLEIYSYAVKQAKPGVEIFELAVEKLGERGILPANVLYVGNDMLNDIRGARLVGFKTALFAGDQRSLRLRKEDKRVDGVVPDIIVNCLSQIPDCLV